MNAKIREALNEADEACEGENYHDRVGLAAEVFDAVESLVAPKDKLKLARAIAQVIQP